jgi:hypothetical protein
MPRFSGGAEKAKIMTKDEAKAAVESELRKRRLTKRMTPAELLTFCQEMYSHLQFKSKSDRLQDIRSWAERWQSMWLRE